MENKDFLKIEVKKLVEWNEPNGEGCLVSDMVTKEGYKVGYMYRENPDPGRPDSGWRFLAGNESDEYINNPDNCHIMAINTVCNLLELMIKNLKLIMVTNLFLLISKRDKI